MHAFQVFTLDFGTTHIVDINHMYFDTPSFFDLPFQAILCTLANIIVKEDREADAINYLNENFLNIPLCVDVKWVVARFFLHLSPN